MLSTVLVVALLGPALALSLAAAGYILAAIVGVRRFRTKAATRPATSSARPPATIIKPVCGREADHYENLRSFCDQDYPVYQVVFVARSGEDPSIPVIERIIAELPQHDISLVVDPAVHGANRKVSNLINAFPAVKHEVLVISDADMRVGRGYLAAVMASFADPRVGAATCLYRGAPKDGIASELAALSINEWFLPSVLVSGMLDEISFCFGSTMAIRRDILVKAGGFGALADVLADDYMIGQYAQKMGYRVALCSYVVDNVVHEPSLPNLMRHELRWARTIRALRPDGYRFSFLMNTISVAIIAAAINHLTLGILSLTVALIGIAFGLRIALHQMMVRTLNAPRSPLWMIPLRDILSFVVWLTAYFGRGVRWRGAKLAIRPGSVITVESLEST